MKFVRNIALFPDLTLGTSERIVLRKGGNGPGKLLEEIVLALCHFLHIRFGPLVISQLVIHN